MPDTNKNNQVDPDEAEDTVKEEEIVSDAFQADKITKEEAEKIDDLGDLEKEADKIEMAAAMGKSAQSLPTEAANVEKEDAHIVEIPQQEEKPAVSVTTPAEVVQESTQEQTSEQTAEPSAENTEVTKEFKQGI